MSRRAAYIHLIPTQAFAWQLGTVGEKGRGKVAEAGAMLSLILCRSPFLSFPTAAPVVVMWSEENQSVIHAKSTTTDDTLQGKNFSLKILLNKQIPAHQAIQSMSYLDPFCSHFKKKVFCLLSVEDRRSSDGFCVFNWTRRIFACWESTGGASSVLLDL